MGAVFDLEALTEKAAEKAVAKVLAALPAVFRAELKANRESERLSSADMASRYGKPTVEAFNRWVGRKGGAHVRAIAKHDPNGRRYWMRAEVEALESMGAL